MHVLLMRDSHSGISLFGGKNDFPSIDEEQEREKERERERREDG